MSAKNKLIQSINNNPLEQEIKDKIIASLQPHYAMMGLVDESVELGDSKFGGYPHLPKGEKYPIVGEEYYAFVLQLNLTQLAIPKLPQSGMLYFFVGADYLHFNIPTRVLHFDSRATDLEIVSPPEHKKYKGEIMLDAVANKELKLHKELYFSADEHRAGEWLDMSKTYIAPLYSEQRPTFCKAKVFGYEFKWRHENQAWMAYLAQHGMEAFHYKIQDYQIDQLTEEYLAAHHLTKVEYFLKQLEELIAERKDSLDHKVPLDHYLRPYFEKVYQQLLDLRQTLPDFIQQLDFHRAESKKWINLLEFSSIDEAKIAVGDGYMNFFISTDDLVKADFSKVFCHYYW